MPVYRREGTPFWWYSFTVNGRRFRGSTGRTAKREAEEFERDQRHRVSKGQAGSDWTLITVLNAYWNEHARFKRTSPTIHTHLAELQTGIGETMRTSRLTAGDLMDYRARRRGTGVQLHSINREFAYLRAAYQHCHAAHGQPLPAIDWKKLKAAEPPGRTRFLSRDEYRALLEAAHVDLRPIILCAVTTGLREGDILRLEWRQVKLEERLIQIARIKGNKAHSVRIGSALLAELARTPPEKRRGKVFDTSGFRYRWYAAVKLAKLTDLRFHDLRHTFASWARQAGADIADIKEALGHTSINMTMRYAHIKPDEHVTAFDRVSTVLLAQNIDCGSKSDKKGNG